MAFLLIFNSYLCVLDMHCVSDTQMEFVCICVCVCRLPLHLLNLTELLWITGEFSEYNLGQVPAQDNNRYAKDMQI